MTVVLGGVTTDKYTEIPLLLHENGWTKDGTSIAVVFPQEHTTKRTCGRLVRELRSELGHLVGFSIPYQSATCAITKIEYLTYELLIWEIMIDPLIRRRSVIVLEQVHTRSLWSDAALGILKMILPHRRDLRLVISVAPGCSSMVSQLQEFFRPAVDGADIPVLPFNIEDVRVPVECLYLMDACSDYVEQTLETITDIYSNLDKKHESGGDMLVYLPTRKDVEQVIQRASNELQAPNIVFMPYFSATSVAQYQAIMNDDYTGEGIWRIIVATDVADEDYELLAKGRVTFVIDSGLRSILETNTDSKAKRNTLIPISVARADSRRLMASNSDHVGKCYRLYTEQYHTGGSGGMPPLDFPESFYIDLTEFSLRTMSLTIPNVATDFPYFAPNPPMQALSHALEKLYYLKAINSNYELTLQGTQMAECHLPVMLSRAIVASSSPDLNCAHEMLSIAGMVLAGGIDAAFFDPSGRDERRVAKAEHEKFQVKEGDHMTLLNIFESFRSKGNNTTKWTRDRYLNYRMLLRAQGIRTQLADYFKKQDIIPILSEGGSSNKNKNKNIADHICQSICKGYFLNAAKRTTSPEGSELDKNGEGVYYSLLDGKGIMTSQHLGEGDNESTVVQAHFTSVQNIEEQWVVYEELVETSNETKMHPAATLSNSSSGRWYIKGVTGVKSAWLLDTNFYKELKAE